MNREIQFRAWHVAGKEMLPNVQKHIGNDTWAFGNMLNNPDEFKMMQYTGLKDKNGKEIYEGDVVEYEIDDSDDITNLWGRRSSLDQYIEVIKWKAFFRVEKNSGGPEGCSKKINIEVIGNVYENPEWLIVND